MQYFIFWAFNQLEIYLESDNNKPQNIINHQNIDFRLMCQSRGPGAKSGAFTSFYFTVIVGPMLSWTHF